MPRMGENICERFCDPVEANLDFLDHIYFADEANFPLSGNVNTKNNVLGYVTLCTACVIISKNGIIDLDPYWFDDENERTQNA